MKELIGLLIFMLLFAVFLMALSDPFITYPQSEEEVEVAGLAFDRPEDKRSHKVVVKWGGKLVTVFCDPFKAGGLKAGDRVTVETRKSWLFGQKKNHVKED